MTSDHRIRRFRSTDAARVRDLREAAMRDVGASVESVGERESEGRIVAMGASRPIEETDFAVRVFDTRPTQTAARELYEPLGDEAVARERIEGFDEPLELLCYRKSLVDAR